MSDMRIIAAMIAAAGGRIEIPDGIYEQVPAYPGIRTWRAYDSGSGGPRYVWALDAPDLQEIQEREQEAYEAWLADQRREAVEEALTKAETVLRVDEEALGSTPYTIGQKIGLDVLRVAAGLEPRISTGLPVPHDWPTETPNLIPASWVGS